MVYMKSALRNKYIKKRNTLTKITMNKKSTKIYNLLITNKFFKKANTILFYVSMGSEVNTQFMLKKPLKNLFRWMI